MDRVVTGARKHASSDESGLCFQQHQFTSAHFLVFFFLPEGEQPSSPCCLLLTLEVPSWSWKVSKGTMDNFLRAVVRIFGEETQATHSTSLLVLPWAAAQGTHRSFCCHELSKPLPESRVKLQPLHLHWCL